MQKLEPKIFKSNVKIKPERWIKRYELYALKNQWNKQDKIDVLGCYLDERDGRWYELTKQKVKTWDKLNETFLDKYISPEIELKAWKKLQMTKQQDDE
ncbi:hypothetical protein AYI68_g6161 [Smittium mucronatum]|uniref:Uncharacterized protein n=1 Tax=Smittium mucronatum TaxID=133383 RepID=A0A1R0GS82_9FUNG|nr:hypothetical protein AYI68_g6161 [Smittium mucronatum]